MPLKKPSRINSFNDAEFCNQSYLITIFSVWAEVCAIDINPTSKYVVLKSSKSNCT